MSDHDDLLDAEAAEARIEALLENQEQQHHVDLGALATGELMTLMAALSLGAHHYAGASDSQAGFLLHLQSRLEDDHPVLNDIADDFEAMAAAEQPTRRFPRLRGVLALFANPFTQRFGVSPDDMIFSVGMLLVLVQFAGSLLSLTTDLSFDPAFAAVTVGALVCFSAAMGAGIVRRVA